MMNFGQWVVSLAMTVLLVSLAENLIAFCQGRTAAQWILRLILLWQLLIPLDALVRWLRGG